MARTILAVSVPINADRYLPGIGIQIYPVGVVEVGVDEKGTGYQNGLTIDANKVQVRISFLLRSWNGRTLIQKGTKPPKNLKKPPVFVDFYPSSENIAKYVFRLFFRYPLRFDSRLSFARVANTFLTATHYAIDLPS